MDIDTLKAHRSGPTDNAYIGTDGRLRAYGDLPAKYTPEALLHAVNKTAPAILAASTQAIQMMQLVKDTANWGTITRAQARHYCATVGLPNPMWPGSHPPPSKAWCLTSPGRMIASSCPSMPRTSTTRNSGSTKLPGVATYGMPQAAAAPWQLLSPSAHTCSTCADRAPSGPTGRRELVHYRAENQ